jgi:hypothetical protein
LPLAQAFSSAVKRASSALRLRASIAAATSWAASRSRLERSVYRSHTSLRVSVITAQPVVANRPSSAARPAGVST